MITAAFSIDSLFDGQDGPSNSFKHFEVDSVCRVFFMFIGIRFYGARTRLPDTDKTRICPDEARFAHFLNLFGDLLVGFEHFASGAKAFCTSMRASLISSAKYFKTSPAKSPSFSVCLVPRSCTGPAGDWWARSSSGICFSGCPAAFFIWV
jgi:hypothetical protein